MQDHFYRDTWVEINLDAIKNNVKAMRNHIGEGIKIIAVVKANGYGHGAVQVANTALKAGASMLAVAFLDEALSLRKSGITAPLLVLGATRAEYVPLAIENNIMLTAYSFDWLKETAKFLKTEKLSLHIKLDTGMGRLGIADSKELEAIFSFAREQPTINIMGIYTHFATADEENLDYFHLQYSSFKEFLSQIPNDNLLIHCGNSATGLRFPDKLFNAVRFGISMYGLSPSVVIREELPFQLEEAFTLHTKLVHVKKIKKGSKVSYGAEYEAIEDEWIGTLPIGYADGWIRKLKDSRVLIDGQYVPLVGRICMDQCMIKLPIHYPVGTKVTLIGNQGARQISVDEVASRLETINYEITCMITSRVPRIFLENKSIIEVSNPLLANLSKEC